MTTTPPPFVKRLLLDEDFILTMNADRPIHERSFWPAKWVSIDPAPAEPFIAAYRCPFALEQSATFGLHVTADERYDLYLDGRLIGRGPERGDGLNWFYQSYQITLEPGRHMLVAIVQGLGSMGPLAQLRVKHGLLVAAEQLDADLLNTGKAPWQARPLTGVSFQTSNVTFGTGSYTRMIGGKMNWGSERGEGDDWTAVKAGPNGRAAQGWRDWGYAQPMLRPSILPAMRETDRHVGKVRHIDTAGADDCQTAVLAAHDLRDEHAAWNTTLGGSGEIVLPPHTDRRVIIDLENYYCAYPMLKVSGGEGATVNWQWAESLFAEQADCHGRSPKLNRDEIENKYFMGIGDCFEPDGQPRRLFTTHWWRAGRYLQIHVKTGDAPLTIDQIYLRETGYPLDDDGNFDCSDERYRGVWPVMVRVMQMCSHEHYMDCPYYEQLMYIGDSRLEALTNYCMTADARLPRKAVETFGFSRLPHGLTQSRYPSRDVQIIAPFSLWWVCMVHDYAMWRDDRRFIERMLPGVRTVLDAYALKINGEGLVEPQDGWNFVDWVPGWERGSPSGGDRRPTTTITMQFVLALLSTAEMEQWLGESAMAQRWRQLAQRVFDAATDAFFDAERGLFAESDDHRLFTEHAQCLALLTDLLSESQAKTVFSGWQKANDLSPCSIYFTHYVFEMLRKMGRIDLMLERMKLWYDLPGQGFKTTVEAPEPSRSDCHAWGAHPIYHAYASILGIRPEGFGFKTVRIQPQLGSLNHAEGTLPHPLGDIVVKLRQRGRGLTGTIDLPMGLTGTLILDDRRMELAGGRTTI